MLHTDSGQDADWISHSWRGNNIVERVIGGKIEGRIPGADKSLAWMGKKQAATVKNGMGRGMDWFGYCRDRWWAVVNVVMNIHVTKNMGNVAYFLPVRVKDVSAPLYMWRKYEEEDVSSYWMNLSKRKVIANWKKENWMAVSGEMALGEAVGVWWGKLNEWIE